MTYSDPTRRAFHPPAPLTRLYFPSRASSLTTHLSLRCAAEHPRCDIYHVTRRAFIANLFNALLLAAAPAHAQQLSPKQLDTSANSPPPSQPPSQLPSPPTRRPTWGYSSENGPETWATLSDDWRIAASGTSQSPIPLSYRSALPAQDTPRPTLTTNPAKFSVRLRQPPSAANPSLFLEPYLPPPPPLVGDAPPVDTYTPPPIPALVTLSPSSPTYALKAIHFHVTAEHIIEDAPAPIELHCVFEKALRKPPSSSPQPPLLPTSTDQPINSSDSKTSSISVSSSLLAYVPAAHAAEQPIDPTDSSVQKEPATTLIVALLGSIAPQSTSWLTSVLKSFTNAAGEDGKGPGIVIDLDMASVLPQFEQSDMYMYTGSLTTPPCTEGIQWLVLPSRFPIAQSDVDTIMLLQGGPNARTLQETNDRRVVRFSGTT